MFRLQVMKLQIPKSGQISCAHKPYFLMPSHRSRPSSMSPYPHIPSEDSCGLVLVIDNIDENINKAFREKMDRLDHCTNIAIHMSLY